MALFSEGHLSRSVATGPVTECDVTIGYSWGIYQVELTPDYPFLIKWYFWATHSRLGHIKEAAYNETALERYLAVVQIQDQQLYPGRDQQFFPSCKRPEPEGTENTKI